MTEARAKELLAKAGAILVGHFVGQSGKHLSVYVAKDKVTRYTSIVMDLCLGIAECFVTLDVSVVVAPAKGAIALSQWTAYWLTQLRPERPEVLALYSEHKERMKATTAEGHAIIIREKAFELKREFDLDVKGKRVLVVEDILTTGESALGTVRAVKEAGGIVVGLGVLANGGGVTAEMVEVTCLQALLNVNRQIFTEEDCLSRGLCAEGVPINTEFGHGKEFLLARQNR